MTDRTKRIFYGRWQRLVRWEFWPVWAVYPPVFLWWVIEAIRYGGWTLWTNCNPRMLASGMAMESKSGILDAFKGPEGAVRTAKYIRLKSGSEFSEMSAWMAQEELSFPIVLKPDLGLRGQGVEIIKDETSARRWLSECEDEIVVQELIGGIEFGVHWAKFPDADKGEIASLCGKLPQFVDGDGEKTLEELILADDRAVMMTGYYFSKYADQLSRVLPLGEKFTLAPIGTHARGAVFTDERKLVTPELIAAFDELGARYEGFHFGRYDVKVPSVEELQVGKNIIILELNGVTGEPAHIYQPGYPWWKGMRDLCLHFSTATQIGAAHRDRGVEPPSLSELWELTRAHAEKEYLEVDEFKKEGLS
ncbi:hypothetical protein N9139_01195 [Akkermansiaceae bacterium]|nr:hypothetical protein [Akkermansiaceae bacterium]